MELWNEFREQAKQDLASSEILFSNDYFGNSAYFLQQCIEKYVKAVALKFIRYKDPKSLGHLPIIKLCNELINTINNELVRSAKDEKQLWSKLKQITEKIQSLFDSAIHDSKIDNWKESLGLQEDEKSRTNSLQKIEEIGDLLDELIPGYQSLYDENYPSMSPLKKKVMQRYT